MWRNSFLRCNYLFHFPSRIHKYSTSSIFQATVLSPTKIIEISGNDSVKFLQGLCTNQVSQLRSHGDCMSAAFLTAKGRVFSDAILYYQIPSASPSTSGNILIEVDELYLNDLKRYLMIYKLKSQVSIKTTNYSVFVDIAACSEATQSIDETNIVLSARDPRAKSLGNRIIYSTEAIPKGTKFSRYESFAIQFLIFFVNICRFITT